MKGRKKVGDFAITDVHIFQGETGFIKGSLYIAGDRIRAVGFIPRLPEDCLIRTAIPAVIFLMAAWKACM